MDFKDVSSKFKQAKQGQDSASAQPKPVNFAESYRIRAKMVGVLLRDARLNADRSADDCARLLRVTPQQIEAWEFGEGVPSLPQLELLANYLDVPVSHFWSTETISGSGGHSDIQKEYLALRDRMVGALLRQAREDSNVTLDALSQASHLSVDQITRYELGELPIPIHELSVLVSGVNRNMSYFLESSSFIGQLLAARQEWKDFADMPEDVRRFAANPLNAGFIEFAVMLSQMPTDKLRQMAESMLEITM